MDITETFVYGFSSVGFLNGLLFLYVSLKSKRKSPLFFGLAWFFSIAAVTSSIFFTLHWANVFAGLSQGFLILGILGVLKEEHGNISILRLRTLYLIPLTVMVFGIAESIIETEPEDGFVIGGIFGLFATFVFVESLKRTHGRNIVIMGLLFAFGSLMTSLYPIFRGEIAELSPYAALGVLSFSFLAFFSYYKIIFSERFFKTIPQATIETPELRGVHLESPEEFENLKESLKDYPVLAFMRGLNSPEGWTTYKFSTIEGENVIYPTDLYKITDFVFRYLAEAKNKGVKGVVVLEGLEFLRVYNDFKAVAKMIASVRDYVLSYEGALIVVLDEKAWDEKELNTLKRMLL